MSSRGCWTRSSLILQGLKKEFQSLCTFNFSLFELSLVEKPQYDWICRCIYAFFPVFLNSYSPHTPILFNDGRLHDFRFSNNWNSHMLSKNPSGLSQVTNLPVLYFWCLRLWQSLFSSHFTVFILGLFILDNIWKKKFKTMLMLFNFFDLTPMILCLTVTRLLPPDYMTLVRRAHWNHDGKEKVIFSQWKTSSPWNLWNNAKSEMQQRNLVFLRLPCLVYSNDKKQSAASDGDRKRMCTRKAPVVEAALVKWIDNAWSRNAP